MGYTIFGLTKQMVSEQKRRRIGTSLIVLCVGGTLGEPNDNSSAISFLFGFHGVQALIRWPNHILHPVCAALYPILHRDSGRCREDVSLAAPASDWGGTSQSYRDIRNDNLMPIHVTDQEHLCWRPTLLLVSMEWRYWIKIRCTIATNYDRCVGCCFRDFFLDTGYWWLQWPWYRHWSCRWPVL